MSTTLQTIVMNYDHFQANSAPANSATSGVGGGGPAAEAPAPALFDTFYEDFLCSVMSDKDLSEKVFTEFVALQSDAERVEYLMASRYGRQTHFGPFQYKW